MTTVTNRKSTFDANTNPDIDVKTTSTAEGVVQHVNIDSIPSVDINSLPDVTVPGVATNATLLEAAAGLAGLLSRLSEYLRAMPFVNPTALGHKVQAQLATDSTMNIQTVTGVTTVTNLTNFNGVDSRLLIWAQWDTAYNTGIRSKIV